MQQSKAILQRGIGNMGTLTNSYKGFRSVIFTHIHTQKLVQGSRKLNQFVMSYHMALLVSHLLTNPDRSFSQLICLFIPMKYNALSLFHHIILIE